MAVPHTWGVVVDELPDRLLIHVGTPVAAKVIHVVCGSYDVAAQLLQLQMLVLVVLMCA
jgi:hypothetical protein